MIEGREELIECGVGEPRRQCEGVEGVILGDITTWEQFLTCCVSFSFLLGLGVGLH